MPFYIPDAEKLLRLCGSVTENVEEDIRAALQALSLCPVVAYAPFTEQEVRLIAVYRINLTIGGYDFVWPGIVAGGWESWIYAIHEAAELQSFAELDLNPFDSEEWKRNWQEPHFQAILQELRFLRKWARLSGFDTTGIAIEIENPIRSILIQNHRDLVQLLETRMGWTTPSQTDLQMARRFWQYIRQEGNR